ncbi:MAG: hypothetical protein PHI23_03965 [Candidatus Peribacteraceae bacterium]|nr:hypothetical protein [Candidatus Peribacteraceae bacterium]
METTSLLYWKVRTERGGRSSVEFMTASEIAANRQLIAAILGGSLSEDVAYVKIGPANFQSLADWKREHR